MPDKGQIKVATDALRKEAETWDAQGEQLKQAADKTEGLRLTRLEAGLFQLIVGPYDEVVNQVKDRCVEGGQQMHAIADSLTSAANTYDEEEAANLHKIHNVY